MAWWNRRLSNCLGCQAKDQELARLRVCGACKAREEHIKDLQAQMAAKQHAWSVERQEYKTAIDRLLAKEGQQPVGAILATPAQEAERPVMNLRSMWEEREPVA